MREGESAFLNVDVDVLSRAPLERMVAGLGSEVSIHHVGPEGRRHGAHFSLYAPRNADRAVRRLAKLIGDLPRPARRLWNEAQHRVFNVGFQGGHRPHSLETEISAEALAAVARLGASIAVTIYAAEGESPKRNRKAAQR